MKAALLSDIHGNADALQEVLLAARKLGADQLFIAGDLVGYYYKPGRVLELLRDWTWTMVRGNHEDMLRAAYEGGDRNAIRARFGSGIDVALENLTPRQVEDLTAAPVRREIEVDGRKLLLCHGSPWDPNKYVYPDAVAEERKRMVAGGHDLVVFGHTHFPVIWSIDGSAVVNPGSVGQPRDGRSGACWASWDSADGTIALHREDYDMTSVIDECRRRDPHLPRLVDVLTRS